MHKLVVLLGISIGGSVLAAPTSSVDSPSAAKSQEEREFLRGISGTWFETSPSHYEMIDNSGAKVIADFGESARQSDIAELKQKRADLYRLLEKKDAVGSHPVVIRASIAELSKAIDSLEFHSGGKGVIVSDTASMTGCGGRVSLRTTFEASPSIILGGDAKIDAVAQSGSQFAMLGTLTTMAQANQYIDTDVGAMTVYYGIGSHISSSTSVADWDCSLETRAMLTPSCSTYAGYRRLKWTAACWDVIGGLPIHEEQF